MKDKVKEKERNKESTDKRDDNDRNREKRIKERKDDKEELRLQQGKVRLMMSV